MNHVKGQHNRAEGNKTKKAQTSKASCTSPTTFNEEDQNSTYNKLSNVLPGMTQQCLTNQHTT
jgi:hypothetical protein